MFFAQAFEVGTILQLSSDGLGKIYLKVG